MSGRSVAAPARSSSSGTNRGAVQFTPTATIRGWSPSATASAIGSPADVDAAVATGVAEPRRDVDVVEQPDQDLGLPDGRDRLEGEQVRPGLDERLHPGSMEVRQPVGRMS